MDLQARVKNILTKPAGEWVVIAAEPTDVASLYRAYIAVLAAIPAICLFIGLFGIGLPFLGHFGLGLALTAGISTYVRSLVSVFVAAIIIEKLAPSFGSSGDTAQALKMVAYSSTPVWIGGVVYLVYFLSPLMLLAVAYAIYLFYLGLAPVMKTPADKVVPYMIVSALVIIVVNVVLQLLLRAVTPMPGYGGNL